MGARRADWVDKTAQLLRDDTAYFQVVFTIPDKLSSLVLGNRRALYKLLFRSAASALQRSIHDECGMQAAATMVLHTWNQRLGHHAHIHALVPGSGPSLDGKRWIECKMTKGTRSQPAKPILVDNKVLGQTFCGRFMKKLNSLRRRGLLELEGNCAYLQDPQRWTEFTASLVEHAWCVFMERPPTAESTPDHVLKYLARYMTGGPISDRRLVSCEADTITFLARSKDKSKPKQQVHEKLSGVEFMRRWSLHILPKGFTKTRCYGGYSSRCRGNFIALCKQLCPPPPAETISEAAPVATAQTDRNDDAPCCPRCQQAMQLTRNTQRPSWRDLFYGPSHQPWFER